jgi:hypothetical protein
MKFLPPAGPARNRQLILLGVLLIGAAYALSSLFGGAPASPPPLTSNSPAKAVTTADAGKSAQPEKVALEKLEPVPEEPAASRNPFRFGVKAAPPPPPAPAYVPPVAPMPPPVTAPPVPQVPPIPLKFIGRLVLPNKQVVASLSDGKGNVISGSEGQVIDGRYRIVRIGEESIVIEYLNGTGRTTLPLRG